MLGKVRLKLLVTTIALIAAARPASAVQTKVARADTFDELSPGEFHNVSLSDQGKLSLAPELKPLCRPDVEIIWTIAVSPEGRIFLGTGHEGKILTIEQGTTATVYLDCDSPEVTALLFHDGKLYAGTSPDGKLWLCDKADTATLVFDTGQKYIWDLAVDPSGKIILATGTEGKIFAVDPAKKEGQLLFDSPDENVLSICFDPKGRLLAATQGKGRVYRWRADRATSPVVIFEAPEDEVRRIVCDPEGRMFAAVNSAAMARRVISPLGAILGKPSAAKPSTEPPKTEKKPLKPSAPPGKSEIFLIDRQGFVRSLWKVAEAPVHDMILDRGAGSVLIAAGSKGKLFRLDRRGNYWIVSSVEEEQVFALRARGKGVWLSTVGPTVVYHLAAKKAGKGEYISPAIDAGATVRWGALRREGQQVEKIQFSTRSGNTKEPDSTWYDWKPVRDGKIQSPVARYLQWRAAFKADGADSAVLDAVEVFFVRSNEPPAIKKIEVKKVKPRRPSTGSSKPASTAPRPGAPRGPKAKVSQVSAHSNAKKFEITWQVSDPNGDPVESALYLKAEDE